ncbi:SpoIIE family protein phosphatase [Streptomyces sp. NPDC056002]|uniref:SpoIIE family protein phosphatase n=1 Tax=Streptomyces sp. NPDC056002 TaxID=3345675 RepID=UPI0035DDE088
MAAGKSLAAESGALADGGTTSTTIEVCIDDVTGHDLPVAVTMGQLRNMLRALVCDRLEPPGEILRRPDRLADALLGHLGVPGGAQDDIALIAVRLRQRAKAARSLLQVLVQPPSQSDHRFPSDPPRACRTRPCLYALACVLAEADRSKPCTAERIAACAYAP